MDEGWTPSQIVAAIAAISALLTALLSKHLVSAVVSYGQYRQQGQDRRRADKAIEDELNERGYKFIIKRQDRKITELETEIEELRQDHDKCKTEKEALRIQYTQLAARVAFLEGRPGHQ